MQLVSCQPAFFFDLFPACRLHVSQQFFKALGERSNKLPVNPRAESRLLPLEKLLQNSLDRRHIPIDAHWQIQIRKRLSLAQQSKRQLQRVRVILRVRILHPHQAHFRQRVDRDNLGTLVLGLLQRGQHPRMVRAWIVPENKDELRTLHVLQRRRALANSERLHHGYTGRLVAHVRAIRKIVRPELASKQLQKKGRLIGRLSRGIEGGLIGRIQTVQLLRNHGEGLWPRNRLIVDRVRVPYHRRSQTALLVKPVIRLRRQLFDRILREELRRNALLRGLVRDRLRSVLAELEDLPLLVRTRPSAALAIKPGHVVDLQKRFRSANRTHIANAVEHRVPDRRDPRRLFRSTPDPEFAEIRRVLRLLRRRIICIQLSRLLCAFAVRRVFAQLLLDAIMSVPAPLISVDNSRAVWRVHDLAPVHRRSLELLDWGNYWIGARLPLARFFYAAATKSINRQPL